MWLRYRDNFLFLVFDYLNSHQNDALVQRLQQAIADFTSMQITVEQHSQHFKFLECFLGNRQDVSPIGLPDFVNLQIPDTVHQLHKLMDPKAPTVEYMLQSLIPN